MSWEENKYLLKVSGNRLLAAVTIVRESDGSATGKENLGEMAIAGSRNDQAMAMGRRHDQDIAYLRDCVHHQHVKLNRHEENGCL